MKNLKLLAIVTALISTTAFDVHGSYSQFNSSVSKNQSESKPQQRQNIKNFNQSLTKSTVSTESSSKLKPFSFAFSSKETEPEEMTVFDSKQNKNVVVTKEAAQNWLNSYYDMLKKNVTMVGAYKKLQKSNADLKKDFDELNVQNKDLSEQVNELTMHLILIKKNVTQDEWDAIADSSRYDSKSGKVMIKTDTGDEVPSTNILAGLRKKKEKPVVTDLNSTLDESEKDAMNFIDSLGAETPGAPASSSGVILEEGDSSSGVIPEEDNSSMNVAEQNLDNF